MDVETTIPVDNPHLFNVGDNFMVGSKFCEVYKIDEINGSIHLKEIGNKTKLESYVCWEI